MANQTTTMSSREKRMRKAKEKAAEGEEGGGVDERLPPRLFATDRYPSKRHKRLGGNDWQLLVDFVGEKLPKHTWLTLNQLLDAENEAELMVQPMVEPGDQMDEGWGEFDCEIQDRRVVYMLRMLGGRHKFKKTDC